MKTLLIARTEGNPLFLEESVRALVETGALSGERGAYRLAQPLPAIQVPATVQAILAARIDRLTPDDKALLQTASVIGKDVPFALLQATAALAEDELRGAIGRLQTAEFLYETSLFPGLEYTFKHALTHDVTYGSLLQDRRRRLHGQIVEAVERLYPDRLAEHIERLAHHAFRAEAWEQAVTYLRQAGAKALARSANRDAVVYFEQALTALTHRPESRETQEQAIDLRFGLRNAGARLLLLVNYRPEYQHGWSRKTYYSQLRLDALPPESAGELLQVLLGDDLALEPLKRLLVRRGKPFFIEESIRTLVETHALTGERGAYRPTRPIQAIEVPATVQVILAARIDRLPADDKELLQTASVIGKDVPFVLLHAVTEAAEDAVQRGLTHLQAGEFLSETRLFPEPEYTFKHALTHEVTYGTLLQERRKALHARIVDAIERSYPDRLSEHVERLAHHAVRGEMWDKAVTYSRQAGTKAVARSANREAVACFEQALAALGHLPERRATLELAVDIRFELRTAVLTLGRMARVLETLREAEAFAERLGDQRRLAQASIFGGISHYATGELDEALTAHQRALGLAASVGDVGLQAVATEYIGLAHAARTDYRAAVEAFVQTIRLLPPEQARERFGMVMMPAVFSQAFASHVLGDLGGFTDGLRYGAEALRLAETPGDRLIAHLGLGALHLRRGDVTRAISHLETGVGIIDEFGLPLYFRYFAPALGLAYALADGSTRGSPWSSARSSRTVPRASWPTTPARW